ncbi:(2Fe-2S)-binding protein [Azospirillum sp. TSO5]|uniref:(2Fe-2S)-binding protein n=1 Tax=Azospirillum sp. TSO5 TaxID=716760 RepID=UPI000D60F996|nr:(2Fe-2S)-binding protein [Azospirillum sp. TSO5]PWC94121.1 (2Fe-2S)-binding protein [Azospirillum sp. TSO5]
MTRVDLDITINGDRQILSVEPHWTLLQVLRNELGLTGTKENCLEAECGVCTVLLDGAAVASCITLALQCRGRTVVTIEGLAPPGKLDPIQKAFIEHGAVQCGYCIPGMVMTAKSFLDEHAGERLSEEQIREGICGTLCRCTGYRKIVDAVAAAAAASVTQGQRP